MVFVTRFGRDGYLRQKIDSSGRQIEYPDIWDIRKFALVPDPAVYNRDFSISAQERPNSARPSLR